MLILPLAMAKTLTTVHLPILLTLLTLSQGCIPLSPGQRAYMAPYRAHPEFAQKARSIKGAVLAPPDIKIYSLSAGGVEELREDWSTSGRDNVSKALQARLRGEGVTAKAMILDREAQEALEEIRALFRAVSWSVLKYTYSSRPFQTKLERFEYSVGSIDRILQKHTADALILVYGFDQISTGGRQTLQAVGAILPFVSGPRKGTTGLCAALVDRSGTILWYNIEAYEGGYDLRDPDSASRFVKVTLTGFPRLGR